MTDRAFNLAIIIAFAVMLAIAGVAAVGARATTNVRIERQADINAVLCQLDPTTCDR